MVNLFWLLVNAVVLLLALPVVVVLTLLSDAFKFLAIVTAKLGQNIYPETAREWLKGKIR